MQNTPKGLRLQIGVFGRRNVGKSSFVNAVTGQNVSIVSKVAGTTTDPVDKAMELLPIGPILFMDTAGVDDTGDLGDMRVKRSRQILDRTDVAVLVAEATNWGDDEEELLNEFETREIPAVVVLNKADIYPPPEALCSTLKSRSVPFMEAVAKDGRKGVSRFRELLMQVVPEEFITPPTIVGDLINPGDLVVLVVPIDLEAPKGRLILPQVQTIRDVLDHDAYCTVVKERELRDAIEGAGKKPALVITDSQAFLKVAGDTPEDVPVTSFSVLFARFKGDLQAFAEGALAIDRLESGSRVLIAEACTHHPIGEDIGRVKIPRWLRMHTGVELEFDFVQGQDFPGEIDKYDLIIHCGSCTFNRRNLLSRVIKSRQAGVPITNYGMCIAYTLGIFERALRPFPGVMESLRESGSSLT